MKKITHKRIKRVERPSDMFKMIEREAMEQALDAGCRPAAGKVLGDLASHMKFDTKRIRRSQDEIAVATRLHRSTVNREVQALCEVELLHDHMPNLRNVVHLYTVRMDWAFSDVLSAKAKTSPKAEVTPLPSIVQQAPQTLGGKKDRPRGYTHTPSQDGTCYFCGYNVIVANKADPRYDAKARLVKYGARMPMHCGSHVAIGVKLAQAGWMESHQIMMTVAQAEEWVLERSLAVIRDAAEGQP